MKIIPADSRITFVIKNVGLGVDGTVSGITIETNIDSKQLKTSYLKGSAQANTVFTDNEARDEHIKKEDFFDVEKYPLMKIESKKIYKTKTGFAAIAQIEIKGKSKEITIPFTLTKKAKITVLESDFSINRLDFGVGDDGVVLSDEVLITLNLSFTK